MRNKDKISHRKQLIHKYKQLNQKAKSTCLVEVHENIHEGVDGPQTPAAKDIRLYKRQRCHLEACYHYARGKFLVVAPHWVAADFLLLDALDEEEAVPVDDVPSPAAEEEEGQRGGRIVDGEEGLVDRPHHPGEGRSVASSGWGVAFSEKNSVESEIDG